MKALTEGLVQLMECLNVVCIIDEKGERTEA
jgi:hypothetical protein